MTFSEFLGHCTACGGNWTAMVLSGIQAVAPKVYEEMPDRPFSFGEACFIANHLCYDRPHFRFNLSIDGNIIEHTASGTFAYYPATAEQRAMSAEEFFRVYNGHIERM